MRELAPSEEAPDIQSFEHWELGEETQGVIRAMDITVPTPIQRLAIGPVLEGRDVIAKAETGTGKTLAFGAPMMSRIDPARSTVLGLVLCPTRELAQQVAQVLEALALPRGVRVALVVGGDPMQPQVTALQSGAQVVVGTPGRVLDLYQQRFLSFPWTEFVVLDEADKMFEIGFLDEVRKILDYTPEERQTLLFSATFPTEVLKLARHHTREPVEVATARGTNTVEAIDQYYVELSSEEDRVRVLANLLRQSGPKDIFLIFCDRRTDVDKLFRRLERSPYSVKALHGGYDQASRFRVMSAFRTGEVKALVATDVASRGLDVLHVTHVINFGVPRELEDYAHRVGRTGRAGRQGTSVTLVAPIDQRRWNALYGRAKWPIHQMDPSGRPIEAGGSERGPREVAEEQPRSRREGAEDRGRGAGRTRRPRREDERDERPRAEPRSEGEPRTSPGREGAERPRRRRARAEAQEQEAGAEAPARRERAPEVEVEVEAEPRQRERASEVESEPRQRERAPEGEGEPRRRRSRGRGRDRGRDREGAASEQRPAADGERVIAEPRRARSGDESRAPRDEDAPRRTPGGRERQGVRPEEAREPRAPRHERRPESPGSTGSTGRTERPRREDRPEPPPRKGGFGAGL